MWEKAELFFRVVVLLSLYYSRVRVEHIGWLTESERVTKKGKKLPPKSTSADNLYTISSVRLQLQGSG